MGICHNHLASKTPRWLAESKLNRRTILKSTAMFGAAAAMARSGVSLPAAAAGTPTVAADWVQPDGVGGQAAYSFQSDFTFYALAPHWPQGSDNNTAIEVATSADGVVWTSPTILGPAQTDAGRPDRDNRVFGQLAYTGESNFVRYRALNANGEEQTVPGLTFTYIDATGGPTLQDIPYYDKEPSLQRPPVISRNEWGANLTYGGAERGNTEWIPEYQTVEHVIIHHSETSNFRDPLTEIRSIHYYHAITRGWGDIGYNYLVDFMGNVYEGRYGGDNVVGGHAYQYAYGSSGICVMGSYSVADATPEMLSGLIWITAWAGRYLDPLSRADFHETPNLPTICAHRDVNDSSCPGDAMYADLDYVREAVAQVLTGVRDTVPDPAYSPGETIQIINGYANLRGKPGLYADILASPGEGTVFQIIEGPTTVDGELWYHVRGNTGSGWLAQSTFTASTALPPAGDFAVGDEVLVSDDMVNLRSDPSLRASVITTISFLQEAVVIAGPMPANGYTWYKVETSVGSGWLAERYLAFEEDIAKPARLGVGDEVIVVEPGGVALRSNPSTAAPKIGSLPVGTRGTIINGPKNARGYQWIQIQTPRGTGWSAEEFFDDALLSGPKGDEVEFVAGTQVFVDTDQLNLRESPDLASGIVRSLGEGVSGTVLNGPETGNNFTWYQLDIDGEMGWAVASFLRALEIAAPVAPQFAANDMVYISTDYLNMRQNPGLDGSIVATLHQYDSATVLAGPQNADGHIWYEIRSDNGIGWVASQYLGKGTADTAPVTNSIGTEVVSVDGDAINIRSMAGISAPIVGQIPGGAIAEIIGGTQQGDAYTWVNVGINGVEGWAVKSFLAPVEGSTFYQGTRVRVIDGELNLRAASSLGAEVIAILPDATYAEVIDTPIEMDGIVWYRVSTSRYGTGWASGEFLERA